MPTLTTDGNGVETTFTYGCIDGNTSCSGTLQNLYPTKTEVASNSALKRTTTTKYDFYTGLVTSTYDVDNDVTNAMEYDDLGRPVKAITAQGTALESWTQTTHDDANRRVIVKSDLQTKGDYKKVATQFFDQLGRVRLTKTLEDSSTQSATNEIDGIKVQTRYKTVSGYTYQLASNPYRANYPANETDMIMGWTLATGWSSGIRSETQSFGGAGLPTAFGGSNTNSTGIVRTDVDANATTVTDQAGKLRRSITNALGQLTRVDEPNGSNVLGSVTSPNQDTSYAYDTLNNLTTVTQGSQTRTFSYSSLSGLLTAANPESGTISYGYDSTGNLTSKVDARSITTSYTYDKLNRVTLREYSDSTPDVSYLYDNLTNAKGKLTKVSSSVSTTEYTAFDILGRVTAHKQTTDGTDYTTAYAYNLSGALIEETYPSTRKVKNVIDNNGDLALVESKKNSAQGYWTYANSFAYNAAGAVTSMQLGNGRWESTVFNSRLQPTQIALGVTPSAPNLLDLNFTYGTTANNGNVLTQDITVKRNGQSDLVFNQTYAYDSLNRITSAEEKTGATTNWKQVYAFDRYGNRNFDEANTTTLLKNCGTSPNFTVCTADVPKSNPAASTTTNKLTGYTYDSTGNVVTDADGRTFTYDAENKQLKVENSSEVVLGTYYFDGDGKRVKKVVPSTGEVTIFVYDASGKLIVEYSTIIQASNDAKVQYVTSDNLGTPRINTDANGAITSRADYMPYGEEIVSLGGRSGTEKYIADDVRQGFTGYENDGETTLDFAQARNYKSQLGRFTGSDPYNIILEKMAGQERGQEQAILIAFIAQPQHWNRYTYVLNNPLILVDPTGELWTNSGTNQWTWVDKCPEKTQCFVAVAVESGNSSSLFILGSSGFEDRTEIKANANGVIDLNLVSAHHDANFLVAKDQTIPEEFLSNSGAAALFNVARQYGEQYPSDGKIEFTAGAETTGKGCYYSNGTACHRTHDGGNAIDVRYMDKNGNPLRKSDRAYADADLSRATTMIAAFASAGFNTIYTGQQSRFSLATVSAKIEKIHRNHLHAKRGGTPTAR
jgi:RHS repeat-associated protein